jgi:hypothetical protein
METTARASLFAFSTKGSQMMEENTLRRKLAESIQ